MKSAVDGATGLMKIVHWRYLVFLVLSIVLILSFIIHMPRDLQLLLFGKQLVPPMYTDIVNGVYDPLFRNSEVCLNIEAGNVDRWININTLQSFCAGEKVYPIPYIDYKFEYPPIIGALWIASTYLAYLLASLNSIEGLFIHYIFNSLALGIAAFVLLRYFILFILRFKNNSQRYLLPIAYIVMPSFIVYSIYNWDLIPAAMTMAGLWKLFYERKYFLGGLLIGLAASAKVFPIVIAAIVLYELYSEKKYVNLKKYLYGVIVGLTPYLMLVLASPTGFNEFIKHHASWYCENCIYMYITYDIWSPYNRALAFTFIIISLSIIALAYTREHGEYYLVGKMGLALVSTIVLNYVFSPQMILLITPFILLYLQKNKEFILYSIADLSNALIMILWFREMELRRILSFLGIPVEYNPWAPDSPIQILAFIRNIILVLLIISIASRLLTIKQRELQTSLSRDEMEPPPGFEPGTSASLS